jgi:hypothetical protein
LLNEGVLLSAMLSQLAESSRNFSGAELAGLVRHALTSVKIVVNSLWFLWVDSVA